MVRHREGAGGWQLAETSQNEKAYFPGLPLSTDSVLHLVGRQNRVAVGTTWPTSIWLYTEKKPRFHGCHGMVRTSWVTHTAITDDP